MVTSTLTDQQEHLVMENTKLVHYFARRYYVENTDYDDLVQEGMFGLIRASKIFDVNRGYKFSTLAGRCINGEIVKLLRKKRLKTVSLNASVAEDLELNNIIACQSCHLESALLKTDLRQAFGCLSDLERTVISYCFGFATGEPLSQRKVSEIVGLSQPHIGRIRKRALIKLREETEK